MIVSMLVVALVGTVDFVLGVCTGDDPGTVGTLVQNDDCTIAKGPALGFDRREITFPIVVGTITISTVHNNGSGIIDADSANPVSLNSHGFTTACGCDNDCPVSVMSGCDVGTYVIDTADGGFVCVKFGDGSKVQAGNANTLDKIVLNSLTVTITLSDGSEVFNSIVNAGTAATSDNGNKLHAFVLVGNSIGVFFSECGPLIIENARRKREPETVLLSGGTGVFVDSVTASGDPHLAGAHGIKFDVSTTRCSSRRRSRSTCNSPTAGPRIAS
jgi:hypothetical protein